MDVKLCDATGGGQEMLDLVKSGQVTVDNYTNNGWTAKAATQSLIDARPSSITCSAAC